MLPPSPRAVSAAGPPPLEPPIASFVTVAARFAPAPAVLYEGRELLRRVDTKFVSVAPTVATVLEPLRAHYAALTVPGGNVATYRSVYLDTPDRVCFHDHRRGRRVRHKVRIRHYPDRGLTFLEVKTKRNELVTDKHRLALGFGVEALGARERGFLRERVGALVDGLRPVMAIEFQRLSLVGVATNERVTIDLGLTAREVGGASWSLGALCVLEIKQAPFCPHTPIMRALQAAGLRERSLSKYTVATAMLNPHLRRNRLLPDLRALERMMSS